MYFKIYIFNLLITEVKKFGKFCSTVVVGGVTVYAPNTRFLNQMPFLLKH
jgi:hypothetical protein